MVGNYECSVFGSPLYFVMCKLTNLCACLCNEMIACNYTIIAKRSIFILEDKILVKGEKYFQSDQ